MSTVKRTLVNVSFYDPEAIARISHGRTTDNNYWMRFDDEDLTWEKLLESERK